MNTPLKDNPQDLLKSGQTAIMLEAQALDHTAQRLDQSFVNAVQLLLHCQGRVIVMGLGKSGHIARKIAATLASTGSPAFFVHSAEAVHGDLGMITGQDVVIAISYSGQSAELSTVLPVIKRLGTPIIAICGHAQSDLAVLADVFLDGSVSKEACPLNLAPTSSTTVALALGDALAIACLTARNFGESDFARSHPGGALGRRLLTHNYDVMREGKELPIVSASTSVLDALTVMSDKRMGLLIVCDKEKHPLGIFTDGDLRRLIVKQVNLSELTMADVMITSPFTVLATELAVNTASLMEEKKLTHMLVVNPQGQLLGALHMHDLMAAKVI